MAAFEAAIEAGADTVEFDVRLTADRQIVVTHWLELEKFSTPERPPIRQVAGRAPRGTLLPADRGQKIPTFGEVLDAVVGRIGLDIEIKGLEAELARLVADVLKAYRSDWSSMELTSYEPAQLLA